MYRGPIPACGAVRAGVTSPLPFASPRGQEAALSAGAEGPIRRSGPVSSRRAARGASARGWGKGRVSAKKPWIHEASPCSVISSLTPRGSETGYRRQKIRRIRQTRVAGGLRGGHRHRRDGGTAGCQHRSSQRRLKTLFHVRVARAACLKLRSVVKREIKPAAG